jgi:TonB family protein
MSPEVTRGRRSSASARTHALVSRISRIRVTLSDTGEVVAAGVYDSSGNAQLDDAALAGAKASTYAPEIEDCRKITGSYLFRAEFSAQ